MKRGNFLKSLATLIAAPSIVGKIEVAPEIPIPKKKVVKNAGRKSYVSAISFLDQREINPNIIESDGSAFVDTMKVVNRYNPVEYRKLIDHLK